MAGGWHQFLAPIDGKAQRFAMRCENGEPKALVGVEEGFTSTKNDLCCQLVDLNSLMAKGLPWGAVCTQRQGVIGAIIEAAEVRRAEIYGGEVTA